MGNQNPKISVIIPVYNAEEFIHEALESVLNQTFTDIELICVNDGSKDNSLEILMEFQKMDKRVKIINQENAGCGAARNRALDEATGNYIYFFDPDDYILPNAFEDLYNNAVNNDSDIVMFKIARFRKGHVDYSKPGFPFEKEFKDVDFNNFTFNYKDVKKYVLNASFAPWTKLYKKEFLDKYDNFRFPLNVAFDDTPFHVQSMLRAEKISFIPEFYYHYRFNPNSVNNTSSNGIHIFTICDIVEDILKSENYYSEFKEEFKQFKITQILNYLLSTDSEEYFNCAKKEFKKLKPSKNQKFNLVLDSNSLEEYKIKEYASAVTDLKNKYEKLTQKEKTLSSQNIKLKKELKNVKKLNNELKSSKCWKITKPLRKLKR